MNRLLPLATAGLIALVLSTVLSAQAPSAAQRESEKMQQSLAAIVGRSTTPAPKGKPLAPLRTSFTDKQFNAWLGEGGKDQLPAGLVGPRVTFDNGGKIAIRAVVDLDAVRKSKERGWLDPLAYLNGFMEISMDATFYGSGGQGTFDVVSATLGNVPVPRVFLQELIAYYSKSTDFPNGILLGKPFPLPAAVRDVSVQRGLATVVQ